MKLMVFLTQFSILHRLANTLWARRDIHSRSRPFPGIIASDSPSQILGMFFSFPSRSRILGMPFFHPLPVPKFWEWIFQFPSRSRTLGMEFSIPVPVPEPSKVIPAHPWFLPLPGWADVTASRPQHLARVVI